MAWVVKRQKLNFKKGFFWNTLISRVLLPLSGPFKEIWALLDAAGLSSVRDTWRVDLRYKSVILLT